MMIIKKFDIKIKLLKIIISLYINKKLLYILYNSIFKYDNSIKFMILFDLL